MSTEIHVGGLSSSIPGAIELTGEFDRVLHTAADRPHTDTLPALRDPAADHGDVELKRRRDDVEEKHERIRQFLDASGHDAVVLGLADSVAWFTSGGDLGQCLGSRAKLDPAVHQPDVAGGHRRQCPEQPRLRGRAGGTGFSAQGAALV